MSTDLDAIIQLEAKLLDDADLERWLSLYAEHATYWIPMDETADPRRDSSIVYDTFERLAMRVHQLVHESRVAQSPPSRTMRMLTGISITETSDTEASASWNQLLIECRTGDWRQHGMGETRLFPAQCRARFTREGGAWRFAAKTLLLLNRHQPVEGLSFIL
jgi:3-phenylpropionate/cinnamic acid dioxygenase small subunit